MQPDKTLSTRPVFHGKIVQVRVDAIRLPDGSETEREVVGHSPAVVIVPIDNDNNVILVRQYRYPIGTDLLEAPAGIIEDCEEPKDCAQRELREETGYQSNNLQSIGSFWTSPGFCTEKMYVYLARELTFSPLPPDSDEYIKTETVPLTNIKQLVKTGEIQDSKTIAAFMLAFLSV